MAIVLIFLFGLIIPGLILIRLIMREEYFTIRTFALAIYMIEALGGFIPVFFDKNLEYSYTIDALFVYAAGFYLFLVGHTISQSVVLKRARPTATKTVFITNRSFLVLFFITILAILAALPLLAAKVEAAGGWFELITGLYQYRYGTYTEDFQNNAIIVLSSLFSSLSGAFILMLYTNYIKLKRRKFAFALFVIAALCYIAGLFLFFSRAAFVFSILSLLGYKHSISPFNRAKTQGMLFAVVLLILPLNYAHQYLYFLTAGWEEPTFVGSLEMLQGPHGHIPTLATILAVSEYATPLWGETFPESILFFIPRFIWTSKNDRYGTIIVQEWSGLPTHYQKAPTATGEFIAHFGYIGILLMLFVGLLSGWFDKLRDTNEVNRAAYYGFLVPRTFAILGMGVSAISITVFQYLLFLGVTSIAKILSRITLK